MMPRRHSSEFGMELSPFEEGQRRRQSFFLAQSRSRQQSQRSFSDEYCGNKDHMLPKAPIISRDGKLVELPNSSLQRKKSMFNLFSNRRDSENSEDGTKEEQSYNILSSTSTADTTTEEMDNYMNNEVPNHVTITINHTHDEGKKDFSSITVNNNAESKGAFIIDNGEPLKIIRKSCSSISQEDVDMYFYT
eukprot:CAMPEP_0194199968 /NCGR_PEP_ID=MMETSP0156-20130528/780_1 /TAXON_ID=33649 /ORGANISM="Thalassionema nitzschioides, Strain L26-B" /LENGTH=190 /DNA_ID=CAMNT_0038924921 /DNA_START=99 /DNA_END=671 /DNA_ORIENTATION=+